MVKSKTFYKEINENEMYRTGRHGLECPFFCLAVF